MPEISLRYALDIPEICLRYTWDILEISLRYAWDMPEMCLRYAGDMSEISLRYSWHIYIITGYIDRFILLFPLPFWMVRNKFLCWPNVNLYHLGVGLGKIYMLPTQKGGGELFLKNIWGLFFHWSLFAWSHVAWSLFTWVLFSWSLLAGQPFCSLAFPKSLFFSLKSVVPVL